MKEKEVKKLSLLLPDFEVLTSERHYVLGRELIAQGDAEREGVAIEADTMYEQKMPVIIEKNHGRAMKKLNNTHGATGVIIYFNTVQSFANGNNQTQSPKN